MELRHLIPPFGFFYAIGIVRVVTAFRIYYDENSRWNSKLLADKYRKYRRIEFMGFAATWVWAFAISQSGIDYSLVVGILSGFLALNIAEALSAELLSRDIVAVFHGYLKEYMLINQMGEEEAIRQIHALIDEMDKND